MPFRAVLRCERFLGNDLYSHRNWGDAIKKDKKEKRPVKERQQPPAPIGTKPIMIGGQEYQVKIYAPCEEPTAQVQMRPRLEPLTESIIEKYGETTCPDYNNEVLGGIRAIFR